MCHLSLNWISILENVLSGVFLAGLLFFLEENVFSIPDLSGMWTFVSTTDETGYKKYEGMKLTFIALLWCEGNKVYGTVEKVSEVLNGVNRRYKPEARIHLKVNGKITRNIFSKNEAILHFEEKGLKRESSTEQKLIINGNEYMSGLFESTVANSKGKVQWSKGDSGNKFSA